MYSVIIFRTADPAPCSAASYAYSHHRNNNSNYHFHHMYMVRRSEHGLRVVSMESSNSSLILERQRRLAQQTLVAKCLAWRLRTHCSRRLPMEVLFCEANLDFRLFLFFHEPCSICGTSSG
jgi:hypothetical protein